MASLARRLKANAPGPYYVDSSCIDCAACRWIAPGVFVEGDGASVVARQPEGDAERLRAGMALVACPTGSIGTHPKMDAGEAVAAFPELIEENVHFCGFTSESSFGAASWLIVRAEGNVLIDSPRAAGPLMDRIEAMGGVSLMFLTHRDDVADHEAFHRRFGCARVLHRDDVGPETLGVERLLEGRDAVPLAHDLLALPTPGHTKGHAVLLYRDTYLFTGDHLAWSPALRQLHAFRDACWYSWPEQIRSMETLASRRFIWVLPGHGWPHRAASFEQSREELQRCLLWMKRLE